MRDFLRARRFDLAVTLVCCATLGYFGWHAFKGPRGFPYRDQLMVKAEALEVKFKAAEGRRLRLEKKVLLLRPDSIDPDMLEEMARSQLQLARPGDLVAYTPR